MLDKRFRTELLFDLYGALLTEKQQYCLELHYLRDISLSEIAVELDVSRQAVYDILRRSEQLLEDYEEKLKLAERHQQERKLVSEVYALLSALPPEVAEQTGIRGALSKLQALLD